MRGPLVVEWLARSFELLGYHFQNWMLVALAIILIGGTFQLLKGSSRG